MDQNVQRASNLDTTALSDALDRLGIPGQCLGIKPLDSTFRLAGRAFTLLYGPAGVPPGTVGDFIDDVPEGNVIVIDNGGRENATVWGDILTMVAHRRNIADARVLPADILRGDGDGVVVIPQAHEESILAIAEEIDAIEEKIRHAVLDGMRLTDARKRYGYHQLQSKKL